MHLYIYIKFYLIWFNLFRMLVYQALGLRMVWTWGMWYRCLARWWVLFGGPRSLHPTTSNVFLSQTHTIIEKDGRYVHIYTGRYVVLVTTFWRKIGVYKMWPINCQVWAISIVIYLRIFWFWSFSKHNMNFNPEPFKFMLICWISNSDLMSLIVWSLFTSY